MSTQPSHLDVTPAFFFRYDALCNDSMLLDDRRASLDEAQRDRRKALANLDAADKQLASNRANQKEQDERIKLVSTHWFYGTTALQPQLWLRGGCTGKIRRASRKLEQARRDEPGLVTALDTCRRNLPHVEALVKERQESYEVSKKAEAERAEMKEGVIRQNATAKLKLAQEQQSVRKERLTQLKKKLEEINKAKRLCRQAESEIQTASNTLRKAERIDVPDRVVPCAGGCGYAVSSWHRTHCCSTCQRSQAESSSFDRPRYCHDRMDRSQFHQQQNDFRGGLADKEKHDMRCERMEVLEIRRDQQRRKNLIHDATAKADDAGDRIRQANSIVFVVDTESRHDEHVRGRHSRGDLRQTLDENQAVLVRLQEQIGRLSESAMEQECLAKRRLEMTEQDVDDERERIFSELRRSMEDQPAVVVPSAPCE